MQIIRTVLWGLLAAMLAFFIAINGMKVHINVWPDSSDVTGYIYVQWPAGLLVLVSFFAGLLPMWLLSKAERWRLRRRISTLENSVRATTPTPHLPSPASDAEPHEN